MTNQKKTELIDFFDLAWTKNPQFLENFLKMEAIFSQNSPQNCILETSIRHKNSEKGPTFSSKIPQRVDIETVIVAHPPSENIMSSPPPPGCTHTQLRREVKHGCMSRRGLSLKTLNVNQFSKFKMYEREHKFLGLIPVISFQEEMQRFDALIYCGY